MIFGMKVTRGGRAIRRLERKIRRYEQAMINCCESDPQVRKFGSDEATIQFFCTRFKVVMGFEAKED